MAYSKEHLKGSGDEVCPYYRPFWIEKLSDKLYYTFQLKLS
jgi:hypothetical protein